MSVWHRFGRCVMATLVLSLSAAVAIARETVLKSGDYRLCFHAVEGGTGVDTGLLSDDREVREAFLEFG